MRIFFKKLRKKVSGLELSIVNLKVEIEMLRREIDKVKDDFIDCHTCGCVVRKEIAFRGHDQIEREEMFTATRHGVGARPTSDHPIYQEVVYETWYCKLHKQGKKAYGSE